MKKTLFIMLSALLSVYMGFLYKIPEAKLLKYVSVFDSQWKAKLYLESAKGDLFSLSGEPFGYVFNYSLAIFLFILLFIFSRTIYYDMVIKFISSKFNNHNKLNLMNPPIHFDKLKPYLSTSLSKIKLNIFKKNKDVKPLKNLSKNPIITVLKCVGFALVFAIIITYIFKAAENVVIYILEEYSLAGFTEPEIDTAGIFEFLCWLLLATGISARLSASFNSKAVVKTALVMLGLKLIFQLWSTILMFSSSYIIMFLYILVAIITIGALGTGVIVGYKSTQYIKIKQTK